MAQRCARGKQALAANLSVLTAEQVKLATSLVGVGQGHLFENWAPAGIDDEDKCILLAQLAALDANYPGGLRSHFACFTSTNVKILTRIRRASAYTLNARELLLKSKYKVSSLEGYTAEVPSGFTLRPGAPEMVEAERLGYAAMLCTRTPARSCSVQAAWASGSGARRWPSTPTSPARASWST